MTIHPSEPLEKTPLALWFGILGPPTIWAARIAGSYTLVPYACWWGWVPLLHALTLASLVGISLAGGIAWQRWRRTGGGTQVELGGSTTRTRFMALVGVLSGVFFFTVVVAEGMANLMVDPCQTAGSPIM